MSAATPYEFSETLAREFIRSTQPVSRFWHRKRSAARLIAARDAEQQTEALRDAAEDFRSMAANVANGREFADWLADRADRIDALRRPAPAADGEASR